MTDAVAATTATTASTRTSYSQNRNEFDTDALVEAAVAARLARADSLETKVSANETTIAAYQEMQGLLLTMQESLQALRSDPSSSGRSDDVFRNRTGYLSSSTSTDPGSVMDVTVADGTALGAHEIEVVRIAKAERLGGGTVSSRTGDLGWAGTFTLGTTLSGSSSSANVTVTADMSLDDIVDAINAETAATGVEASVIQVSGSGYMIVLTGSQTAATIELAAGSGDDVLLNLGLTDAGGAKVTPLQQAQTAQLVVDGVTVERDGNDIDDVLDGISFSLYKADPGNVMTLEIDHSLSDIKEQVQALVESYNAFRDFVLANQATNSDGSASDDAVLFGDSILRTVTTALQTALSSSVDGEGLSVAGLSFDAQNRLELDEDALDDALLGDIDSIRGLFSYSMTSSSGSLTLLRHGDGPASADFTLDITVDGSGAVTGAAVDGDTSLFTVEGSRIVGAAGTAYEGLVFVYTGTASKSVDVTLAQGIADSMWQAVEAAADEYDGQLTEAISSLEDANTDLESRIDTIEANAETYRSHLLDKYARIEAKLAEAQAVLDLLEALNNAASDD